MPLYIYTCTKCHHTHESLRPAVKRNTPPPCPKCGGVTVRRLTAATLRFKGDGWQTPRADGE